MQEEKKEHV